VLRDQYLKIGSSFWKECMALKVNGLQLKSWPPIRSAFCRFNSIQINKNSIILITDFIRSMSSIVGHSSVRINERPFVGQNQENGWKGLLRYNDCKLEIMAFCSNSQFLFSTFELSVNINTSLKFCHFELNIDKLIVSLIDFL